MANFDTRVGESYDLGMPAKNGRNVALTDEQSSFIEDLVESGRYASASEVVRDGLRLLQRDEEARLLEKWIAQGLTPEEESRLPARVLERARRAIRAQVREGLDQALRGELVSGRKVISRWKARLGEAAATTARPRRAKRRK